jgi:hypothetical protein
MPGAERVVITIDVNADTAQIEAMRQALRRLAGDMSDLNDENERHRDTSRQVHEENTRTNRDNDSVSRSIRRTANSTKLLKGRYAGLLKQTFAFRKDIGTMISAFGGLIGMVNKLSLIELPLLGAAMAANALLFRSGAGFVNLYRAAMSSLAYAFTAAIVALSTFLAAQKQFTSAMSAPAYFEGAQNTTDRFIAASQAMGMFTNRASLAVVGAKSLTAAFQTLSKEKPVTGQTTAAFEGLMNIVAGSGGDISKGGEKLAEFLAKVQKKGLGGASEEAKALGPDFEKILKEAKELGIKTQEEFFKAAAEGNLGKTFQEKYAGQLDALNNTLIGRFKTEMVDIKAMITDLGESFLGPATDMIANVATVLKTTIIRLSPLIREFGANKFFKDAESFVQKASDLLVNLVSKYLNTLPSFTQKIKEIWQTVSDGFETVQDWARQFVPAGEALIENFFGPLFESIKDKFGGGLNTLSDLVLTNGDKIRAFAKELGKFIGAIGDYGNMLKTAFIAALPMLSVFLKGATKVFDIFTSIMNGVMKLFGGNQMTKAIAAILVIYASLTIFSRFFKTLGGMFGKDMKVNARNVYVNGSPMGGAPMGPAGYTGAPITAPQGAGYRGTMLQRMQSSFRSGNQRFGNFMRNSPMAPMGMIAAGQLFNYTGSHIGGGGGTLVSGAGNALTAGATANMMGIGKVKVPGAALQKMVGGTQVGGAQLIAGAIGAGYAAKGTTDLIQDLSGGKLGKDDALGRLGMTAAGAGVGAATGAAIGATIGGPLAPVTAAAGAIIGTLIGGTIGFINSGKYQKQAREAGKQIMENYTNSMEEAFAAGDLEALATAREEMIKQHQANLQNLADQAEYAKATKELQEKLDKFDKEVVDFTSNAGLAERFLGIGTDALNKLANEAGINLRGKVLTLREMFAMTGRTASQVAAIIKQKWMEISGLGVTGAMGRLQNQRDARENVSRLNEAESAILSGDTSDEAFEKLIESALQTGEAELGVGMGTGSAYNLIQNLLENESYKANVSEEDRKRLKEMTDKILGPQTILDDIFSSETAVQDMLTMIGDDKGGMKIGGANQLKALLSSGLALDPNFIGRLIEANRYGLETGDFSAQRKILNEANKGVINQSPEERRAGISTPAPNAKNIVVNTTINAKVLDADTIKQIHDAVNAALRDQNERSGGGGGRGVGGTKM